MALDKGPYLNQGERAEFAERLAARRANIKPTGWSQADLASAFVSMLCDILSAANDRPGSYDPAAEFALGGLAEALSAVPSFLSLRAGDSGSETERDVAQAAFDRQVKLWRDRIGSIEASRYRVPVILATLLEALLARAERGALLEAPTWVISTSPSAIPLMGSLPCPPDAYGRIGAIDVSPQLPRKEGLIAFTVEDELYAPDFRQGEIIVVDPASVYAAGAYVLIRSVNGARELAILGNDRRKPAARSIGLFSGADFYEFEILGYVVHRELTDRNGIQPLTEIR